MVKYKLSNEAKDDLIRIHHYGVKQFGIRQADIYFESFFTHFELISKNPYSFESVDFIKPDYKRCICGVDSIIYRINEEIVEIMTIIGRQDINSITLDLTE